MSHVTPAFLLSFFLSVDKSKRCLVIKWHELEPLYFDERHNFDQVYIPIIFFSFVINWGAHSATESSLLTVGKFKFFSRYRRRPRFTPFKHTIILFFFILEITMLKQHNYTITKQNNTVAFHIHHASSIFIQLPIQQC